MRYALNHRPAYCTLDLDLDQGEELVVQPGAMIAMDTGFDLRASAGGAMTRSGSGGAFRSLLAGESVFRVVYTARRDGMRLSLGPNHPGDIVALELGEGEEFFLARGSWLASAPSVQVELQYGGVKGWMTRTGLFLLRARGPGPVFCTSHGAVVRKELAEGERYLVDNRYLVAFSAGVTYELVTVTKALGATALSGEGLVTRYTGPGAVIYQTRPASGGFGFMAVLADMIF